MILVVQYFLIIWSTVQSISSRYCRRPDTLPPAALGPWPVILNVIYSTEGQKVEHTLIRHEFSDLLPNKPENANCSIQ